MSFKRKFLRTALTGIVLASSAIATNANAVQLLGWQFDTSGLGGALQTGVNNLSFNGSSFVDTSATPASVIGDAFTFTDRGVFNLGQYNNGSFLPGTGAGVGEVTAFFQASGTGTLGGTFTFNAGGTLDLYYQNGATDFGAATNNYGTTNGTLIASFSQLAGGGGAVNPDGTPAANGQITQLYKSTFLLPGVWKDAGGLNLPILLTLGFATNNAANLPNPDANLQAALSGQPNSAPPDYFWVTNGGQFKLETVPEPSSLALLGLGLLGAGYRKRFSTKS